MASLCKGGNESYIMLSYMHCIIRHNTIRSLKSRRLRWAGHVARMKLSRNAFRVLVGKPEGKRPLGRPRRRWEDNIKMDLREVGCVILENGEILLKIGTNGELM